MAVKYWVETRLAGKRVFISSCFDFEACSYEVRATDVDSLWRESLNFEEILRRGTQVCPFLVSERNKTEASVRSALREIQKALKGEIKLISTSDSIIYNTSAALEQTQADSIGTQEPPSSPVGTPPPSSELEDKSEGGKDSVDTGANVENGLNSNLLRLAVQQPIENLGTLNWVFELHKCDSSARTETILNLIDAETSQVHFLRSGADGLEKEHYKDELRKKKLIENKFGIQAANELKFFDNKKYWSSFKEQFRQLEQPDTSTVLASQEYWDMSSENTQEDGDGTAPAGYDRSWSGSQSQRQPISQSSFAEPMTPTKKRTYGETSSQPSQSQNTISTSIISPRKNKRVRQELLNKKKKAPRRL